MTNGNYAHERWIWIRWEKRRDGEKREGGHNQEIIVRNKKSISKEEKMGKEKNLTYTCSPVFTRNYSLEKPWDSIKSSKLCFKATERKLLQKQMLCCCPVMLPFLGEYKIHSLRSFKSTLSITYIQ